MMLQMMIWKNYEPLALADAPLLPLCRIRSVKMPLQYWREYHRGSWKSCLGGSCGRWYQKTVHSFESTYYFLRDAAQTGFTLIFCTNSHKMCTHLHIIKSEPTTLTPNHHDNESLYSRPIHACHRHRPVLADAYAISFSITAAEFGK